MGPDAIPVVLDEQVARKDPELAVLSAMAHGHEEVGAAIAHTVLAAMVGLDAERIRLYVDLTMNSLSEATRYALEAVMQSGTYEYQSEFARKYVAQGREEGRQEGREEGREEGRHEGEQAALFEVLDARGLQVDAGTRQRILACKDLSQLKLWLRKAVSVESAQQLFEPGSAAKPAPPKASQRRKSLKAQRPRSKR
jgi:hypothetical protein